MTEPGTPTGRPSRAAHGLLAALVGLALLLAALVVGAVPAAAGNRVGASTPVMINTVGSPTDIGAGQRLGKSLPQPSFVVATGVAAEAGAGAARIPFGPGSEKAWNVLDRVTSKGAPLPGYKGGSVFKNAKGRLPGTDGAGNPLTYREWDVNPYVKGVDRGAERLVTGSDGSAYYTGDHYGSFLQFWGPG